MVALTGGQIAGIVIGLAVFVGYRILRVYERLPAGRSGPGYMDTTRARPSENIVVEVETDERGRVLVTVEESADSVAIPPRCVGCLGDPTTLQAVVGVDWLEFPSCDACARRRGAVSLMLSKGGTVRLAFERPEYARLFAEMNGRPG